MYKNVVVAIDGSEITPHVLKEARRLAADGSTLHLLMVIDNPMANFAAPYGIAYDLDALHKALEEQARRVVGDAQASLTADGITATREVLTVGGEHGIDVPSAIDAHAERCGADLILIGSHGRRGFRRLMLGSVSEQVIRQAKLPVLLVRAAAQ